MRKRRCFLTTQIHAQGPEKPADPAAGSKPADPPPQRGTEDQRVGVGKLWLEFQKQPLEFQLLRGRRGGAGDEGVALRDRLLPPTPPRLGLSVPRLLGNPRSAVVTEETAQTESVSGGELGLLLLSPSSLCIPEF